MARPADPIVVVGSGLAASGARQGFVLAGKQTLRRAEQAASLAV